MKRVAWFDGVQAKTGFWNLCCIVLTLLFLAMPQTAFAQFSVQKAQNIKLQKALKAKGFFKGRTTGTYGPKTRRAVRKFQRSLGHKRTGRLSAAEMAGLLREGNNDLIKTYGKVTNAIKACRAMSWYKINGVGVLKPTYIKTIEALEICHRVEKNIPKNPEIWAYLAQIYMAAGDYQKSLKYARASANTGDVKGTYVLADHYSNGNGVKENHVKSFKILKELASRGDPVAMADVGYFYGEGVVVKKNKAKKFLWTEKAARLGYAHAQQVLGVLYFHKRDFSNATMWLSRAASQGNITAQSDLAHTYQIWGQHDKAEQLYKHAISIAEKKLGVGHPEVATLLSNLAGFYQDLKRYNEAERFYQHSLKVREKRLEQYRLEVAMTAGNLGILYASMRRYREAEKFLQMDLRIREKKLGLHHIDVANPLYNLGRFYSDQKQYEKATILFQRCLNIREKEFGKVHVLVAIVSQELARSLLDRGLYLEAEPLLNRSLLIWEKKLGESTEVARVLHDLALLFESQGHYRKAATFISRSLRIREKLLGGDHPDVAIGLHTLADIYVTMGRYEEAESLYQRSVKIKEKVFGSDHLEVATSLNNLAKLYIIQSKYIEAEGLLKRSLHMKEEKLGGDHPDVALIMGNLAQLYRSEGRYREAESLFKRSKKNMENSFGQDHLLVATIINNLGGLYDDRGDYAKAEQFYKSSINIREKKLGVDHPDVARVLNNLALIYKNEGRYREAESIFKRTFKIQKNSLGSGHPDVAITTNNLGVLYDDLGDYAKAEQFYKDSISIGKKKLGVDHPNVAEGLNNLAHLYLKQGRYGEAEVLLKGSLKIVEKRLEHDHPKVAVILGNLAEFYRLLKRYREAEKFYKRNIEIKEKKLGSDHPDMALGLSNYALFYFDQKDWSQAAANWRRARAIFVRRAARKSIIGQGGRAKKNNEITKNSSVFNYLVRTIYRLKRQPVHTDETWQSAQWARQSQTAQALAQMAARLGANSGDLAILVRERQDNLGQWQAAEKRMNKLRGAGKRNKVLERRMTSLDNRLNEMDARLQKEFPEFFALARPKPLRIKDTQTQLIPKEALIQFLFTKDEGFAWLVTKTGAKWVRLDVKEAELKKMVKTLRDGLDDPAKRQKGARAAGAKLGVVKKDYQGLKFDLATSHKLYKILFGQFEEELKGVEHLMIVPSGPLQSLPPAVLVTEKPAKQYQTFDGLAKTPWLIKKFALTVLPSVSSLRALRVFAKNADKDRKPFLGFGDPLLEGHPGTNKGVKLAALYRGNGLANVKSVRGLAALPETATELNQIAASLHAEKGSVYLQGRATETVLKSTALNKVKVIAFSTHGLVSGDLKGLAEPALVMTPPDKATELDDGLLMASEVAQLKLNADWVLLSACNTASSDGTPGAEGLSGLARAFFYAGAKSLLVSHWPVYSDAAVELTTGAFKAQEDAPKIGRAEALRRSILKFMQSGGINGHPERWAPFVIVGEGAQ